MLSAFTVGAVALGATLGTVPSATADPASDGGQKLFVDIVGDSYMASEGTADTYLDSADPRHRSLASPALQALSRVVDENPGIQVDANVVASSGAVTADYFGPQRAPDASGAEVVVNTAQHDQIRPNAQVVIVGFGGSDAELAQVLSIAKPSNSSKPGDLDAKVKNFGGLLDTSGTDQTYLDQATASSPGQAPMLVSRMLSGSTVTALTFSARTSADSSAPRLAGESSSRVAATASSSARSRSGSVADRAATPVRLHVRDTGRATAEDRVTPGPATLTSASNGH